MCGRDEETGKEIDGAKDREVGRREVRRSVGIRLTRILVWGSQSPVISEQKGFLGLYGQMRNLPRCC